MMLVAIEAIEPGAEIRVDYESGNSRYWDACGVEPVESSWRERRAPLPPPSGEEPRLEHAVPCTPPTRPLPASFVASVLENVLESGAPLDGDKLGGLSQPQQHQLAAFIRRRGLESPLPWPGKEGGDARLRALVPLLLKGNPSNWSLIATHVPGRSGRECKERWWTALASGDAGASASRAVAGDAAADRGVEQAWEDCWPGSTMATHGAGAPRAVASRPARPELVADQTERRQRARAEALLQREVRGVVGSIIARVVEVDREERKERKQEATRQREVRKVMSWMVTQVMSKVGLDSHAHLQKAPLPQALHGMFWSPSPFLAPSDIRTVGQLRQDSCGMGSGSNWQSQQLQPALILPALPLPATQQPVFLVVPAQPVPPPCRFDSAPPSASKHPAAQQRPLAALKLTWATSRSHSKRVPEAALDMCAANVEPTRRQQVKVQKAKIEVHKVMIEVQKAMRSMITQVVQRDREDLALQKKRREHAKDAARKAALDDQEVRKVMSSMTRTVIEWDRKERAREEREVRSVMRSVVMQVVFKDYDDRAGSRPTARAPGPADAAVHAACAGRKSWLDALDVGTPVLCDRVLCDRFFAVEELQKTGERVSNSWRERHKATIAARHDDGTFDVEYEGDGGRHERIPPDLDGVELIVEREREPTSTAAGCSSRVSLCLRVAAETGVVPVHNRPRGRAPSGKVWDGHAGRWVDKAPCGLGDVGLASPASSTDGTPAPPPAVSASLRVVSEAARPAPRLLPGRHNLGPPPGWTRERREKASGAYFLYHGPNGEKVNHSAKRAWAIYEGEGDAHRVRVVARKLNGCEAAGGRSRPCAKRRRPDDGDDRLARDASSPGDDGLEAVGARPPDGLATFKRPRGRPPRGKVWDEHAGRWADETTQPGVAGGGEEGDEGEEGEERAEAELQDELVDAACVECGSPDDADSMLLCDGCDAGYHLSCLSPAPAEVPADDWFCPKCVGPPDAVVLP